MEKKECEICFEMKELVNIHDNHYCCKKCLNSIVINPNISQEDGAVCRCPFCRRNICETNNKGLNIKLKYLYMNHLIIINKIYRRRYPKNHYRYSKRVDKDMLKSIKQIKFFKNKKMFKRINNYKKHF